MDTQQLDKSIIYALNNAESQPGKIILITGGPTCEDIDPVRFLTNRSTGKMGIESAIAAKEAGLSPILILGPTHLSIPDSTIPVVNIRSAAELYHATYKLFKHCTFVIMSAAVADFTPVVISNDKLKKSVIEDSNHEFSLKLKRTTDILHSLNQSVERTGKYIAGFSLDTTINIDEGLRKLKEKSLDLIVINSIAAFEKSYSNIVLITKDNKHLELTDSEKRSTANKIITELLRLYSEEN